MSTPRLKANEGRKVNYTAPETATATATATVYFCGCKASGHSPLCDGTNKKPV